MRLAELDLTPPGGWHPASGRLTPLERAQLPPLSRLALYAGGKLARKRTGGDEVPDVFLLLLRHPRLFWRWLRFASRLMPFGTLGRRQTELVILRTGWNCRCRYEWGQHVHIGLRVGLTREDIARVAQGPRAAGWTPKQAAVLQATDELHADHVISAQTWQQLAQHYPPAQLIELGMLVGHYAMLAGVLNSAGLPLEAATEGREIPD